MKKVLFIFCILFLLFHCRQLSAQCGDELINVCHGKLGETRFLKSFPVQLDAQSPGSALPVVRYSMVMNAGTTYRIAVCNAQEYPGKAIFSLIFQDRLIVTSFSIDTKNHFPHVDFTCNMSGLYHIDFYFEDGKEGCAMGVVSAFK